MYSFCTHFEPRTSEETRSEGGHEGGVVNRQEWNRRAGDSTPYLPLSAAHAHTIGLTHGCCVHRPSMNRLRGDFTGKICSQKCASKWLPKLRYKNDLQRW